MCSPVLEPCACYCVGVVVVVPHTLLTSTLNVVKKARNALLQQGRASKESTLGVS